KNNLETKLFCESLTDVAARLTSDSRLARVWLLVRTDYADDSLNLAKACRSVGASKNHLNVLMRDKIGLTFYQFLLRYRVFIAAGYLTVGEHNSLDIALRTGFGTLRAFEKCFRRLLGCSPREFRKHT